jgi:hypothetical protein
MEGYLCEADMAREMGRTVRTLARWRVMQIGPRFTMRGRNIEYSVQEVRAWLAAGGAKAFVKTRPRPRPRRTQQQLSATP